MRDRLSKKITPIFHVTTEDFVPSLVSSEIEKIDNMLKMKGSRKVIPQEVRESVIGGKEAKPRVVSKVFKQKNARQCSFCEEVKEKDLMVCSRCVITLLKMK